MLQKCSRDNIGKKMREARKLPIAPILRPLRNHMLRLAAGSAKNGYCQRAGQEIRKARLLAEENPTTDVYNGRVIQAHARHKSRKR